MTTAALDLTTALASAPELAPLTPHSVVLAIDGQEESDTAIRLVKSIAEQTGARINVVSVSEPAAPASDWPPFAGVQVPLDQEMLRSAQLARVRAQLARVLGPGQDWSVTMRTGVMGQEVAAFAKAVHADVIVAGRGRHGVIDRLLGEEHLARLIRCADAPVLAAEQSLLVPVRRAVIAVDFSAPTIDVARAACAYIAENAAVYLVHVKPEPPFGIPHPGQWIKSYDAGVRAGLELLRSQLVLPPHCTVEPIVLNGHPGVALAEFARASRSELVAVGVQGAGFWNRLVMGRVTTYLLRSATCSLLAVPIAHPKR